MGFKKTLQGIQKTITPKSKAYKKANRIFTKTLKRHMKTNSSRVARVKIANLNKQIQNLQRVKMKKQTSPEVYQRMAQLRAMRNQPQQMQQRVQMQQQPQMQQRIQTQQVYQPQIQMQQQRIQPQFTQNEIAIIQNTNPDFRNAMANQIREKNARNNNRMRNESQQPQIIQEIDFFGNPRIKQIRTRREAWTL